MQLRQHVNTRRIPAEQITNKSMIFPGAIIEKTTAIEDRSYIKSLLVQKLFDERRQFPQTLSFEETDSS